MDTEKIPNYSNYSINELEEALSSVDENRFPERRTQIINALCDRGWGHEQAEVKVIKRHSTFIRALLIACAFYFLFSLVKALNTGQTSLKGGESYTQQSSPYMFYFIIGVHVAVVLASVFELVRDTVKRKGILKFEKTD